jgi:hypothetical protein
MGSDIQRPTLVSQVLADSVRADLAEMLLWPALTVLTACHAPDEAAVAEGTPESMVNARVRACAGAFIQVAADLLLLEGIDTHAWQPLLPAPVAPAGWPVLSERDAWRAGVVDLGRAYDAAQAMLSDALLADATDEAFAPVAKLLRQLLAVAEHVADQLEKIEPTAVRVAPLTPSPRAAGQQERSRIDAAS